MIGDYMLRSQRCGNCRESGGGGMRFSLRCWTVGLGKARRGRFDGRKAVCVVLVSHYCANDT